MDSINYFKPRFSLNEFVFQRHVNQLGNYLQKTNLLALCKINKVLLGLVTAK